MERVRVGETQARAFLTRKFGDVGDLAPLGGGFWSSAYAFSAAGRTLVARFGGSREWFEADRSAEAFASALLPVPEVLEIGEAFEGAYAISARHYGMNLEEVTAGQASAAGPLLASLFGALFDVPTSPDLPVVWHASQLPRDLTWRGWLRDSLVDDPDRVVHGWRTALAEDPHLQQVYDACESRVLSLIVGCPERRDLIHGDLLHANVLVTEDASRTNAVFSWKCSLRGDFLFDTAWCTFCSALYPGIAAAEPWHRVHRVPQIRDDAQALLDAPLRHHCYELHIGLTSLAWNTWVGDLSTRRRLATNLAEIYDRGPLPAES